MLIASLSGCDVGAVLREARPVLPEVSAPLLSGPQDLVIVPNTYAVLSPLHQHSQPECYRPSRWHKDSQVTWSKRLVINGCMLGTVVVDICLAAEEVRPKLKEAKKEEARQ